MIGTMEPHWQWLYLLVGALAAVVSPTAAGQFNTWHHFPHRLTGALSLSAGTVNGRLCACAVGECRLVGAAIYKRVTVEAQQVLECLGAERGIVAREDRCLS